jgi:hypothetical protein
LEEAANLILEEVATAPDHPLDFISITASQQARRCAAVDGGSTVVLNARTAGLYAIRAGYVLRDPDDTHVLRVTTKTSRTATKRSTAGLWNALKRHYGWGVDVDAPKLDASRLVPQLAEAERVLAEFDAARRALHELKRGDVLLVDGSFDDEERFAPLRENLLEWAEAGGVGVIGVSKDTSLSINGILPFTMELEELASARKAGSPWMVDATSALGYDDLGFRVLGMQFDQRSSPYRVDLAGVEPVDAAGFLLGLCNDPAYAGYPYPLARVHQRVHFESGEAMDLRRELEGIVARRRGHRLSMRLFGNGRDVLELAN